MYKPFFAIVPLVLLLVVPGTAQAQGEGDPLGDIISDFCQEFDHAYDEILDELFEAGRELEDCYDDLLDQCFDPPPPGATFLNCVQRFTRCTDRINRNFRRDCRRFVRDFSDALEDAIENAEDEGVYFKFITDPLVQDKIMQAVDLIMVCSGAEG